MTRLDAAIRARLDDPIDIALNGRPYLDAIRVVLDQCVKAERAGVVGWPQILRQMIADKLGVSDAETLRRHSEFSHRAVRR